MTLYECSRCDGSLILPGTMNTGAKHGIKRGSMMTPCGGTWMPVEDETIVAPGIGDLHFKEFQKDLKQAMDRGNG